MDDVATDLARNLRQLRQARGLSQAAAAKLARLPRPTWATLESGAANPTLAVLLRAAAALSVSVEELIARPRAEVERFPAGSLPSRARGGASIRQLLPDHIASMQLERLELAPEAHMTGVPHTPGTREYLALECGEAELIVAGERIVLAVGDVVSFRGDQRHSYRNRGRRVAVLFSVIALLPVELRGRR